MFLVVSAGNIPVNNWYFRVNLILYQWIPISVWYRLYHRLWFLILKLIMGPAVPGPPWTDQFHSKQPLILIDHSISGWGFRLGLRVRSAPESFPVLPLWYHKLIRADLDYSLAVLQTWTRSCPRLQGDFLLFLARISSIALPGHSK